MTPSSRYFLKVSVGTVVALLLVVGSPASAGPPPLNIQEGNSPADPPDAQDPNTAKPTRGGAIYRRGEGNDPNFNEREGGARQMMSRRWRDPSEADISLFTEVAGELNPTWRDSLVQLRSDDPEAFRRTIVANGRRLWQLVELRERNPDLYKLRMKEIQTQGRLRELGQAYRTAVEEGRDSEARELRAQIETMATMQVDIQMRVRGEELAAMADALERLRQDLLEQATERKQRAQLIVERITAPRSEGDYAGERPEGAEPGLDSDARSPRGPHESGTRRREGDPGTTASPAEPTAGT